MSVTSILKWVTRVAAQVSVRLVWNPQPAYCIPITWHACPVRLPTQQDNHAKSPVQPGATAAGKADKKGKTKKKRRYVVGDLVSKDSFCKEFMEVISGEVTIFLGYNPLLSLLYAQRTYFQGSSSSAAWTDAMLGGCEATGLSQLMACTSVRSP